MIINYGRQYIDYNDISEVQKSLKSDYLTQGPYVRKFEKKLGEKFNSKNVLAVSSGSAALHLAGLASGWSKKDTIICSPYTFVASSNAIMHCKSNLELVDVNESDFNLDPNLCEKVLKKKKIKAIIVTDFAGYPADWKRFRYLANKYKFQLINDNCHAMGAKYFNDYKYATKYADIVCMSFHPVKNFTTGEGGAIFVKQKKIFDKAKLLRTHSIYRSKKNDKIIGKWHYEIENVGFNYRLTDIQSALGISQLKKLEKFVNSRNKIANLYDNFFRNIKYFKIPLKNKNIKHAYHLYPIRINFRKLKKSKKLFFQFMNSKGINLQVHYIPLHLHKFYKKKYKFRIGDFPNAEKLFEQEVSLPIFYKLKFRDVIKIVNNMKKFFNV